MGGRPSRELIITKDKLMIKSKDIGFTDHLRPINTLILLNDGCFATCSEDDCIKVIDPKKNFRYVRYIKAKTNGVTSICQLDNGDLVSCSKNTIKIWSLKNKKCLFTISSNQNSIFKLITLSNNRFLSCSCQTLVIWKGDRPYNKEPIKVCYEDCYDMYGVLYIKKKDIFLYIEANHLFIKNMKTYQNICVMQPIYCYGENSLYQLDDDRIITGGKNGVYFEITIINISKYEVEERVNEKKVSFSPTFLLLNDKNSVVIGKTMFNFSIFKLKEKTLITIKDCDKIGDLLLRINENSFIAAKGETVDLWNEINIEPKILDNAL